MPLLMPLLLLLLLQLLLPLLQLMPLLKPLLYQLLILLLPPLPLLLPLLLLLLLQLLLPLPLLLLLLLPLLLLLLLLCQGGGTVLWLLPFHGETDVGLGISLLEAPDSSVIGACCLLRGFKESTPRPLAIHHDFGLPLIVPHRKPAESA